MTPFRCERVSWQTVYSLSRRLAWQVLASGYRPELVVAIARGGFVPARILCDFLALGDLTSIKVEHYAAGAQKRGPARVKFPLTTDVRDRRVLVVDDVNDSGETLAATLAHLRGASPAAIKSAVLHSKQVSSFRPDFLARAVTQWRWILYPWAVMEDVGSFLRQLEPIPADLDQAADALASRWGLRLPRRALEDVYRLLGPGSE